MEKEKLQWLFESMYRIRRFEETMLAQTFKGKSMGVTHSSDGQEAGPAGVCAHLTDKDWIGSTHRGHGHCIAKGLDTKKMMAEIFGKSTGQCKGKGGSMHIADFSKGMLGANAIVGASIPLAVGAALSSKYNGTENESVGVALFGDGATGQGVLHESMNLASIWKLPVIFVCENNFYSVYSPLSVRQPKNRKIYKMVRGCNIKSYKANGNYTYEVMSSFLKAKNFAEKNSEPVFLEYQTFRWLEHCGPNLDDHLKYRNKKELLYWKKNDPIKILENYLIKKKWIKSDSVQNMKNSIINKINLAFKYAKRSPFPKERDLYKYLYK